MDMLLSKRARQLLRQLRSKDAGQPDRQLPKAAWQSPRQMSEQKASVVERAARSAVRRAAKPAPPVLASGPLEQLVPGCVLETSHGAFYLVEALATELMPEAARALTSLPQALRAVSAATKDPRLEPPRDPKLHQLVLLDIETVGFSAAPIFLVGLMLWRDDRPESAMVRQLMARDYAEEIAILAETAQLLQGRGTLITYNGRAFDLPLIQERLVYHRLGRLQEPQYHLDLLPVARKRFSDRWGNCRLQTLEKHLCGRERWGDINGADIPQAYHDFVDTGDAGRMQVVIEHNRLDLISMLAILPHLAT